MNGLVSVLTATDDLIGFYNEALAVIDRLRHACMLSRVYGQELWDLRHTLVLDERRLSDPGYWEEHVPGASVKWQAVVEAAREAYLGLRSLEKGGRDQFGGRERLDAPWQFPDAAEQPTTLFGVSASNLRTPHERPSSL